MVYVYDGIVTFPTHARMDPDIEMVAFPLCIGKSCHCCDLCLWGMEGAVCSRCSPRA